MNELETTTKVEEASNCSGMEEEVMVEVNLTVSEGKRLIAKGMSAMPLVREKMKHGMIILTRGTTNTYLAEELIDFHKPHGAFLTGHFVPEGKEKVGLHLTDKETEIILVDGKQIALSYAEALDLLKEGDLVIKGGNLLNYSMQKAAVCIGAPNGGTVYKFLPYVGKGKAQLIVPIGLEKDSSFNLSDIESKLQEDRAKLSFLPKVYVYGDCILYTEIEAIKQFGNVKVYPNGIGGVSGREGGVSLVVVGRRNEVEKVRMVVRSLQGEKAFHE